MRLIVTHEQPDFDALASVALALELFPGSRGTVQGALQPAIHDFLRLYRDQLDLLDVESIDLDTITELVVVDTADPTRIKPFDQLIGRVPITLYDHHPAPPNPIPGVSGITEQLGATATLLARELFATAATIPAAVATLGLIGIHEDTGNLTYGMTTADDHRAAAYLLDNGANLALVRRYTRDDLDEDQLAFRAALRDNATTVTVAERPVVLAVFEHPTYVPGASSLVSELYEAHDADAAIVIVKMDGKTLVFARSNDRFDSASALNEAVGGGGHPGAAHGKTDLDLDAASRAVLTALANHARPVTRARDVMTAPVRTVHKTASIAEASGLLRLYGHNGMPVLDDDGSVLGVISRRDIERALRHGLGDSRVSGFMSRGAHTARPETSLADLEKLVLMHNIGRLPVVDSGGGLVGIVTRADLIAARHQPPAIESSRSATQLLNRLPHRASEIVSVAARLAAPSAVYLVGGTVRDLLLGAGHKDLDMAVEGLAAADLGERVRQELGGNLTIHEEFRTATLTLDDGLTLDIAAAREEVYSHPGALPAVTPASLRQDLERRDFTINALALRIQPLPVQLIDPFDGATDIRRRRLRVLHPLSFIEDPTRVLRGARLAGRLGFEFATDTSERAKEVLATPAITNVSRARLRAELELTLAEQRVAPALHLLDELEALAVMFGLSLDGGPFPAGILITELDQLRRAESVPQEAYLLALLLGVDTESAAHHVTTFNWPLRLLDVRDRTMKMATDPTQFTDEDFTGCDDSVQFVLRAANPDWEQRHRRILAEPPRRKLRGSDVVALGLPQGPAVGHVLAAVKRARTASGQMDFADELELARRLVAEMRSPSGAPE